MEKVTLTIELESEDMTPEMFAQLIDIAGNNLSNGAKAIKEGNIDDEGKDQIDRIIEEGNWWMKITEDQNFKCETD